MAKMLHSVLVQTTSVAADAIVTHDLPVNPVSVILLCIRPLNDTGTLANFANYLDLCSAFNRITVLYRGASVFSMSGADAAALAYFRHGVIPMSANNANTDNARRCVVLPIMLGKFAYDSSSCFPSTKRGEFTIELDVDVADTGYDNFTYSIETIELLSANPSEYERKTSVARTFPATGNNQVDLPIGNSLRGLLLFGTTAFTGASPAPTWGRVELAIDNEQTGFASTDIEIAMMLGQLMGRQLPGDDKHKHGTTVDGNAGTYVPTLGGPYELGMGGWENYAFLDLDPTRDDEFSLNTSKASTAAIRCIAEAANLVRVVAIEAVKL